MSEVAEVAEVTGLRRDDVAALATMHRRAFSGFFLASLGEPFLREFYRGFLDEGSAVTVVARARDGRPLGVAVGTTRPASFYRRLLRRRWWGFAAAGALGALRHPRAVPRLVRALTYRGDAPPELPDAALLASICVDPEVASRGVGSRLSQEWAQAASRQGARRAYLTTDRDGNDAVNRHYQRHGWVIDAHDVTPEGRRMNRYVLEFEPEDSPGREPTQDPAEHGDTTRKDGDRA